MKSIKLKRDRKMIEIKICLWTNNLPKSNTQKLAWESGMAYIVANKTLGIKSDKSYPFMSLERLPETVEKIANRSDILLVKTSK